MAHNLGLDVPQYTRVGDELIPVPRESFAKHNVEAFGKSLAQTSTTFSNMPLEEPKRGLTRRADGEVTPVPRESSAVVADISIDAVGGKETLQEGSRRDARVYPGIESLAYGRPWAIMPEKLAVMQQFLKGWMAGSRLSSEELQAQFSAASARPVSTAKGVAVIPVYGVLSQRVNMLSYYSGGTSTELLSKQIKEALNNPDVGTIVFDIDSPGGAVTGVPELADEIFAARGHKKMISVSNSLMASAVYWIGTAADEVVVTPSGEVGSIGVYTMHVDYSKQNEMMGMSPRYISAGKYKVEANPDEPLNPEALAHIESIIGDYYEMFTKAVARHRGVKKADVVNGFGEGRVVTAANAVALGMADRVATLSQVLGKLGVDASTKRALALERRRVDLARMG